MTLLKLKHYYQALVNRVLIKLHSQVTSIQERYFTKENTDTMPKLDLFKNMNIAKHLI